MSIIVIVRAVLCFEFNQQYATSFHTTKTPTTPPFLSNVGSCVLMCERERYPVTYPIFVGAPGTQVVDFAPIFFCVRLLRALHITCLCPSSPTTIVAVPLSCSVCARFLSESLIAQHVQGTLIRNHRTFHLRGGLTTAWPHTAGKTFSASPLTTLPVTILPVILSSSMPSLANAARHVCMHVCLYTYVCTYVRIYVYACITHPSLFACLTPYVYFLVWKSTTRG
jgi:hypothetical protein